MHEDLAMRINLTEARVQVRQCAGLGRELRVQGRERMGIAEGGRKEGGKRKGVGSREGEGISIQEHTDTKSETCIQKLLLYGCGLAEVYTLWYVY